jgi:hypothetical protein
MPKRPISQGREQRHLSLLCHTDPACSLTQFAHK